MLFPFLLDIANPSTHGLPESSVKDIVSNVSQSFLGIIATLAVLFVIIGAFLYVTSHGNDEQLGKAKKTITWAVIGLILAALSWSFVNILVTVVLK